MVGPAIHLCPNITGILPSWGVDMRNLGANLVSRYLARAYDGRMIQDLKLAEEHSARWSNPWLMVHRAALHKELRRVATAEEGDGVPAVLEGNLNVVGVDPQKGVVTLENGETVLADVIVGADGIYVSYVFYKSLGWVGLLTPRATVQDQGSYQCAPTLSQRQSSFSVYDISVGRGIRSRDGTASKLRRHLQCVAC